VEKEEEIFQIIGKEKENLFQKPEQKNSVFQNQAL
jgi:hypothetical protein